MGNNIIEVDSAWRMIIDALVNNPNEFPTVPKTNKKPIWFRASSYGDSVNIDVAMINTPSSKISLTRKLTYRNFEKVYPLYLRRENGEKISEEVTKATVNQVYYFSLIKHLVYDR